MGGGIFTPSVKSRISDQWKQINNRISKNEAHLSHLAKERVENVPDMRQTHASFVDSQASMANQQSQKRIKSKKKQKDKEVLSIQLRPLQGKANYNKEFFSMM